MSAATFLVAAALAETTLKLPSGEIRGHKGLITGERYFYGVPFAQPPVGALRWEPPVQEAQWSGVRDARNYAPSCVQPPNAFTELSKVSEDCLYLNFWLPSERKNPRPPSGYPVMLFFYGGSWTTGSAMFPLYSGKHLTEDGVIAIAANYRLNVFGFLGSDRLRASDNSTGNFGIQDQRLAMQWVQRNAAALGADPTRVMIFGESAGAGSVSNHLVRKRSWGLFSRAAMESGPLADWTAVHIQHAETTFRCACRLPPPAPPAPPAPPSRRLALTSSTPRLSPLRAATSSARLTAQTARRLRRSARA
jgi:carboxylesterase type B